MVARLLIAVKDVRGMLNRARGLRLHLDQNPKVVARFMTKRGGSARSSRGQWRLREATMWRACLGGGI